MSAAPAPLLFDPYDYAFHEDPYPIYARLRDEAPLYYSERDDFWALSRHGDVFAAFRDDVTYSNRMGVTLDASAWSPDAHRVMSFLALDGKEQSRIRKLVSAAFTPRRVRELEPQVQRLTEHYLERLFAHNAELGDADWIAELAGRLPMDVISEMMGVPVADRDEVRRLADLLVHREAGVRDVPPAGMEAAIELFAYYGAMVKERRAKRSDDLTSALVEAELDGDRLTDQEIMAFLTLMVVAGNETTTKLLGNALFHLSAHPDQRDAVLDLDGPDLVAPWVEETLRHDNSTQMLARYVTQDVELHGRTMPAGSKLLLLVGAANRDERVFTEPRRLRHPSVQGRAQREPGLRHRPPLLPRRQPGPARGPHGAGRAGTPGRALRGACRPRGAGALGQRARLRLAAGDVRRAEGLMGKYDQPTRRPAVVAGASSGIGAETAKALAAAGHPVALGARRVDRCEELAAAIRADGGEAVAHALDVADDESVAEFAAKAAADLGDIEVVISNAGLIGPGTIIEVETERLRPRGRRQPARRRTGWCARSCPAWSSGSAATSSSSPPTWHSVPGPSWRPTARARPGSKGWSARSRWSSKAPASGRRSCGPGPTWSEMGMDWDADAAAFVLNQWVKWGHARHSHFLKARAIADAITTVVSAPRGVHLSPVDVNPEAPVEDQ